MKHVYVEGTECETTEEYAQDQVNRGNWEVCTADHNLYGRYGAPITVYHHTPRQRGHIITRQDEIKP